MNRLTFLSHFVLCLAVAACGFFAFVNGVPQTIWASDQSMMTSVIGVHFVGSAVYLGVLAWRVDELSNRASRSSVGLAEPPAALPVDTSYGYLAERLCVMAGFVGTAIGLSMQAKALAGGSTSFTALATSLFTTACGGASAAIIAIITFNLEAGVRRTLRCSPIDPPT